MVKLLKRDEALLHLLEEASRRAPGTEAPVDLRHRYEKDLDSQAGEVISWYWSEGGKILSESPALSRVKRG